MRICDGTDLRCAPWYTWIRSVILTLGGCVGRLGGFRPDHGLSTSRRHTDRFSEGFVVYNRIV